MVKNIGKTGMVVDGYDTIACGYYVDHYYERHRATCTDDCAAWYYAEDWLEPSSLSEYGHVRAWATLLRTRLRLPREIVGAIVRRAIGMLP